MCGCVSRASEDDIHSRELVRPLTRYMSWLEKGAVLARLIVDSHERGVNVVNVKDRFMYRTCQERSLSQPFQKLQTFMNILNHHPIVQCATLEEIQIPQQQQRSWS